ncbi:MAG: WGR domain-containing protein [Synergistaceae bacterium]|nr:WGR domain-containing protein [Synergistaceae bacterium]
MEKYLVFEDGKSKKFWCICTEGNKAIVTFGRIGAAGQTQEKAYPTPEAAEKDAAGQAASKLKKGYAEAQRPVGFAPPAANGAKKAVLESGPAPIADNGKSKPWHNADFWKYPWYFAEDDSFAHLEEKRDKPWEEGSPTPKAVPAIELDSDEEIEFDENDDEGDRRRKRAEAHTAKTLPEKLLAEWREMIARQNKGYSEEKLEKALQDWLCYHINDYTDYGTHSYRKAEPYIRALRLLLPNEAFRAAVKQALLKGMKNTLDTFHCFGEDDAKKLQWLLEQGAELSGKPKLPYVKYFVQEYLKNPIPARVPEIFTEYRAKTYAELAPKYARGFQDMVRAFLQGKIADGAWPEGATYFKLTPDSVNPNKLNGHGWHSYGFHKTGVPTWDAALELEKYLPGHLQEMAEAGDFDGLAEKGLPVLAVKGYNGGVLLRRVLNEQAAQDEAAALEGRIAWLEGDRDYSLHAPLLEEAVSALLDGVYLPMDAERARALLRRHLYSLGAEAQEKANDLLCHYDDYFPELEHDRALWCHQNGHFTPAINVMGWAAKKGYAPAAEKLKEFKAAEVERNKVLAKYKAGGKPNASAAKVGKDNFRQVFAESDLFLNTSSVIARAYMSGEIYVRFKIEGEQGYAETLDWLNSLLEKGYARLNDGYQLAVRFLIKPVFIKQLVNAKNEEEGYGFPQNSCHAFFARAVQYPILREKVKRYAENALKLFDWYKDLDGEENCVPGTFAACALAFAEEKYVPMIGLFSRSSDDEHQYIQLMAAGPLFKQYGATPEVAAALFDVQSSNGQDGYINLNKALLTTPACLAGVMEHARRGVLGRWEPHHLEYHVPGYVEAIWGDNTKDNLKKFKAFAEGAAAPEDKNIFVDFHNFYKKYVSLRDKKDFGDDLEGVSEAKKDIVVPVCDENPPVLLRKDEAERAGWMWQDEFGDKRGVLFFPTCVDDPELADFVDEQWETGCAGAKEFSETFNWGEGATALGKWVFNTEGLSQGWGVLLTDGKSKPYVLYGILDAAQLSARWCKRPFKTPEEAESARQAAFVREAPPRIRLTTLEEQEFDSKFEKAFSAVWNKHWWMASQLLPRYEPKHGQYYDAAILLRIKLAKQMGDLDGAAALYDELTRRRPEFSEYLAAKKAALGKK